MDQSMGLEILQGFQPKKVGPNESKERRSQVSCWIEYFDVLLEKYECEVKVLYDGQSGDNCFKEIIHKCTLQLNQRESCSLNVMPRSLPSYTKTFWVGKCSN